MDLDALDAEVAGPMRVRHLGVDIVLPAATDMPWNQALGGALDARVFVTMIWPFNRRVSQHALLQIQAAWRRHNGLPDGEQCRRLAYMMQRYSDGIEYDLRHHLGVSAGELWRGRRWRELLNYIDMLPTNSHMNRLLTTDEEYMEAALAKREGQPGSNRPSMAEFSLTNSLLMQLIDAVHVNTAVNKGIANPKGPKPRIDPVPRPATAAERVNYLREKRRHEEMVAMLLPNRKRDQVG